MLCRQASALSVHGGGVINANLRIPRTPEVQNVPLVGRLSLSWLRVST